MWGWELSLTRDKSHWLIEKCLCREDAACQTVFICEEVLRNLSSLVTLTFKLCFWGKNFLRRIGNERKIIQAKQFHIRKTSKNVKVTFEYKIWKILIFKCPCFSVLTSDAVDKWWVYIILKTDNVLANMSGNIISESMNILPNVDKPGLKPSIILSICLYTLNTQNIIMNANY